MISAKEAIMKQKTKGRFEQRRKVTEAAMLQMRDLSEKHDATLYVALLNCEFHSKAHYISFLKKRNIAVIDCFSNIRQIHIYPSTNLQATFFSYLTNQQINHLTIPEMEEL